MHASSTPTPVRSNVAAPKPLPPYYGFRHAVQPRNAELATLVEIFFRTGDFAALKTTGTGKCLPDQVMILVYLIANDFTPVARELEREWGIGFSDVLRYLDSANRIEAAEALGFAPRGDRWADPRLPTTKQAVDPASNGSDSRVMGRVRDERALAPTRQIPPELADAMTAGAMRDELQVALAEAATQFEHDANKLAPSKHASRLAEMAKRWRELIAKAEKEAR